jgi:hypothetical protein
MQKKAPGVPNTPRWSPPWTATRAENVFTPALLTRPAWLSPTVANSFRLPVGRMTFRYSTCCTASAPALIRQLVITPASGIGIGMPPAFPVICTKLNGASPVAAHSLPTLVAAEAPVVQRQDAVASAAIVPANGFPISIHLASVGVGPLAGG